MKPILDPCCGSKMFWIDKNNPQALFCDIRRLSTGLCDGRHLEVSPDMLCDFTALPFQDETFWHIVYDPPHLITIGEKSWMAKKYGKLPKDWESLIKKGFDECWRVLKFNGTLVFKWSEVDIPLKKILEIIKREPLYAQKQPKKILTHWMCFFKDEKK